jgi:hypothetical protein
MRSTVIFHCTMHGYISKSGVEPSVGIFKKASATGKSAFVYGARYLPRSPKPRMLNPAIHRKFWRCYLLFRKVTKVSSADTLSNLKWSVHLQGVGSLCNKILLLCFVETSWLTTVTIERFLVHEHVSSRWTLKANTFTQEYCLCYRAENLPSVTA